MKTLYQIAAGLSPAQKRALIYCDPWDVEVGAGIANAFICNDLLEDSTIFDDGVQLSQTGLAVRAILKEQDDAK